ncbi:MAG: lamin tail domain-containing protein [Blastopirellula sp. JB062]
MCTNACAPASADVIQVGSWNIEWLGKPEKRKNPPQLSADIAAEIAASGVDVLALQEICNNFSTHERIGNKTLDDVCAILNRRSGNQWKYELFPKRDPYATEQLTGVAWNESRVRRVGDAMRIKPIDLPNDDFVTWDRQPYAAKFSSGEGKTDFVVIPIHMKSNYGDSVSRMRKHRAAEAKALIEQLPNVRRTFGDDDLIIIGDTNALSADEEGLQALVKAGFRDLNSADRSTHVKDDPFDRAFVPQNQPEFANAREVVHYGRNGRDYRKKLSDHYLISFQILAGKDDDADGDGPEPSDTAAPQMSKPQAPKPSPQQASDVRILAVLPDPFAQDDGNEAVVIANSSTLPVSLQGWRLSDDDGAKILLQGEIPACSAITVRHAHESWLSNGGDELRLHDAQGTLIDEATYRREDVRPGKFITNLNRRKR